MNDLNKLFNACKDCGWNCWLEYTAEREFGVMIEPNGLPRPPKHYSFHHKSPESAIKCALEFIEKQENKS